MNWEQNFEAESDGITTIIVLSGNSFNTGEKVDITGVKGFPQFENKVWTMASNTTVDLAEHGYPVPAAQNHFDAGMIRATIQDYFNATKPKLLTGRYPFNSIIGEQPQGDFKVSNLQGDNRGLVYKINYSPPNYDSGDRTSIMTITTDMAFSNNTPSTPDPDMSMAIDNTGTNDLLHIGTGATGKFIEFDLSEEAVIDTISFYVVDIIADNQYQNWFENVTIEGQRTYSTEWEVISTGHIFKTIDSLQPATAYFPTAQPYKKYRLTGDEPTPGSWVGLYLHNITLLHADSGIIADPPAGSITDAIVLTDVLTDSETTLYVKGAQSGGGDQIQAWYPAMPLLYGLNQAPVLDPVGSDQYLPDQTANVIQYIPAIAGEVSIGIIQPTAPAIEMFQTSGVFLYEKFEIQRAPLRGLSVELIDEDNFSRADDLSTRREILGSTKVISAEYIGADYDDLAKIIKAHRDKFTVVLDLFPLSDDKQKRYDNAVIGFMQENKSITHESTYGDFQIVIFESKVK